MRVRGLAGCLGYSFLSAFLAPAPTSDRCRCVQSGNVEPRLRNTVVNLCADIHRACLDVTVGGVHLKEFRAGVPQVPQGRLENPRPLARAQRLRMKQSDAPPTLQSPCPTREPKCLPATMYPKPLFG